jgi:uncharacterized protein YeaO (DUF488 family)
METKGSVQLKRAYVPAAPADGYRVLVERLWPRGLRKDVARLDEWLKEVAPSDALRKWFGHDPARFREFRDRYLHELQEPAAEKALDELVRRVAHERVTLVYAAHDEEHNSALVLASVLETRLERLAPDPRLRSK